MLVKVHEVRVVVSQDSECFDCETPLRDLDGEDVVAVRKGAEKEAVVWSCCRVLWSLTSKK